MDEVIAVRRVVLKTTDTAITDKAASFPTKSALKARPIGSDDAWIDVKTPPSSGSSSDVDLFDNTATLLMADNGTLQDLSGMTDYENILQVPEKTPKIWAVAPRKPDVQTRREEASNRSLRTSDSDSHTQKSDDSGSDNERGETNATPCVFKGAHLPGYSWSTKRLIREALRRPERSPENIFWQRCCGKMGPSEPEANAFVHQIRLIRETHRHDVDEFVAQTKKLYIDCLKT